MFPFTLKNYLLCLSNIKCLPVTAFPNTSSTNQSHTISTSRIENFNPICDSISSADHDFLSNSSDISSDDDNNYDSPPDFATVFASQRFFFSSPGRSNSIIDSPGEPENNIIVPGSIAIQTYSANPLQDFRKSMQEMVEAHGITDAKADWEFMHELLICYLTLNPRHAHKFIIAAFSDLVVSLMASQSCCAICAQVEIQ